MNPLPLLDLFRRKASTYSANARSIFVWDSPERRDGHRELLPIPLEIYHEIFSYIKLSQVSLQAGRERIRDIRSLSLVCRWFCIEMLPLVFQSVVFRPNLDGPRKYVMSFVPFCRAINHGEEFAKSLATTVDRCAFQDWFDALLGPSADVRPFIKLHLEALPNLSNLTTLILRRVHLNRDPKRLNPNQYRRIPPMFSVIYELPRLSSLTLDCCDFQDVSVKTIEKFVRRVKLRTFRLFFRADTRVSSPSDDIILEFSSLLGSLEELGTDSWLLIQQLASASPRTSLKTLEAFWINDIGSFANCLYQAPLLTALSFHGHPSPSENFGQEILLSRLQNLRRFSCPPHLAYYFKNSPSLTSISFALRMDEQKVEPIGVYCPSSALVNIWQDLGLYPNVRELILRSEIIAFTLDAGCTNPAPRELRKLTLDDNFGSCYFIAEAFQKVFDQFCIVWGSTSLTTLCLINMIGKLDDGDDIYQEDTKELLGQLSQKSCFPALVSVTFSTISGKSWEWIREDASRGWRLLSAV